MRTSLPRDTFPLNYPRVASLMLIFHGSGGYRCDPNPQKCCYLHPSSCVGSCLTRRTVRLERRTVSRGRVCPWACVCMRHDFSAPTSCALTLVPTPQHSTRLNGTATDCGRTTSSRKRSSEEVKVPETFSNLAAGHGPSGGFASRCMVLRGEEGVGS